MNMLHSAQFLSIVIFLTGLMAGKVYAQEPEDTEVWENEPAKVDPGHTGVAPSDAIVLFKGNNLNKWIGAEGGEPGWKVENNHMTVIGGSGSIKTKQKFGDCQLHIEWRTPAEIVGEGQGRGNSGVFLQERYELQVLDSYDNRTYSNGQAGSFYKQHIPLVNASRKPGEWQTYDIIYKAPEFNEDGSLKSPARATVFHNGILIQNNVEIKGGTTYVGEPEYEAHGKAALMLQDHSNPVSYRNIWIREL